MSKEIIMAEIATVEPEASPQTEGQQAVPDHNRDVASPEARMKNWLDGRLEESGQDNATTQQRPPTKRHGFTEAQVLANAELPDKERLEAVERLLGPLSDEQKDAFSRMHAVGLGKPSGGVYNYDQPNITEKVRIGAEKTSTGQEVFTKEERSLLLESGLAGALPASEVSLDLAHYAGDPKLGPIVGQILATAVAGGADENFFNRTSARVERLQDEGSIDTALGNELLASLEVFRLNAAIPINEVQQRRVATDQRLVSFNGAMTIINSLSTPATPDEQARLDEALESRERVFRESSFEDIVYSINSLQREPISPVRDRSLQELRERRDFLLREAMNEGLFDSINEQAYLSYREARIDVPPSEKDYRLTVLMDKQQRAAIDSIETEEYWFSLESRGISRGTYRGILDYVRRGNFSLIRAALEHSRGPILDNSGISLIWENFRARDEGGRLRPETITNFDDLRRSIENERRERPRYIGSRGNYLFPIEFIVDGVEELPDAIEDFAIRLEKETLAGGVEDVARGLQERHSWDGKAMEAFMRHFNLDKSHPVIMWYTSKMNSIVGIFSATLFVGIGKEGFKNYLQSLATWGEGFKTKDTTGKKVNDHYFDVLYFDNDGLMPMALDQLMHNQGEFWRYGSVSLKPPSNRERDRYQQRRTAEIIDFMATHELKPIDDLLTTHPVFLNLRIKMMGLDPAGNLWNAYVEEARAWERFVKGIDINDRRNPDAPVRFEHPLARALTKREFDLMYQLVQRISGETGDQYNRRIKQRGQNAEIIFKRAQRLATTLMIDSRSTSARLKLKDADGVETGEIKPFAQLVREEVLKIVARDAKNPDGTPKPIGKRKFKFFHVLNKLRLVDYPTYSAFDVGADDTEREDLIKYFEAEPELKAIIDSRKVGVNAKTTIVRWGEDERRIITLVERAIRRCKKISTTDSRGNLVYADGTDYYNYPGYDTPNGGVKEIKTNILYPYYGISRDTVRVNGLIPAAYYGVQDFLSEFGCTGDDSFLRFVAWQKRRDELDLADEGSAFKNPGGIKRWVSRVENSLMQHALWTASGADDKETEGLLIKPLKGPYRLRGKNFNHNLFQESADPIAKPWEALDLLTEPGYEEYLTTVADVFSKIENVMKARRGIENIYGSGAETAIFLNTLTLYDLLDWMDYFTEEYRGKLGYAIDAHMTLVRYLSNTNIFEDQLISSIDDWHVIMQGGGVVGTIGMEVPAGEGLIDLIPDYLKEQIEVGQGRFKVDPIPVRNNRFYPQVLDLRAENKHYKEKYKKATLTERGRVLL